jgi:hypothetical protein
MVSGKKVLTNMLPNEIWGCIIHQLDFPELRALAACSKTMDARVIEYGQEYMMHELTHRLITSRSKEAFAVAMLFYTSPRLWALETNYDDRKLYMDTLLEPRIVPFNICCAIFSLFPEYITIKDNACTPAILNTLLIHEWNYAHLRDEHLACLSKCPRRWAIIGLLIPHMHSLDDVVDLVQKFPLEYDEGVKQYFASKIEKIRTKVYFMFNQTQYVNSAYYSKLKTIMRCVPAMVPMYFDQIDTLNQLYNEVVAFLSIR